HIDAAARDCDRVIGAEIRREVDVLDIIDHVQARNGVSVPGQIEIVAGQNVVAEKDVALHGVGIVEVGDNEIEIVDQFSAGQRVAGRVGPNQGHAQGHGAGCVGNRQFVGPALAGSQSI